VKEWPRIEGAAVAELLGCYVIRRILCVNMPGLSCGRAMLPWFRRWNAW